jgi:hypothetical protein
MVLCAPWWRTLFRVAIDSIRGMKTANVLALDDYADFRVLWTSLDLSRSFAETFGDLLLRFDSHARSADCPSLRIANLGEP